MKLPERRKRKGAPKSNSSSPKQQAWLASQRGQRNESEKAGRELETNKRTHIEAEQSMKPAQMEPGKAPKEPEQIPHCRSSPEERRSLSQTPERQTSEAKSEGSGWHIVCLVNRAGRAIHRQLPDRRVRAQGAQLVAYKSATGVEVLERRYPHRDQVPTTAQQGQPKEPAPTLERKVRHNLCK